MTPLGVVALWDECYDLLARIISDARRYARWATRLAHSRARP